MSLKDRKKAALWHAFHSLDKKNIGEVMTSQLKVLAYNVSTSLGIMSSASHKEDHVRPEKATFTDFLSYIDEHVFQNMTPQEISNTSADKIDDICWLLCRNMYCPNKTRMSTDELHIDDTQDKLDGSLMSGNGPDDQISSPTSEDREVLTVDHKYQLWRVFNTLVELDSEDDVILPLVMNSEEVTRVVERFVSTTGGSVSDLDTDVDLATSEVVSFSTFLNVFKDTCTSLVNTGLDESVISMAVGEIHEEFVLEILRKGYLYKKSSKMSTANWRQRWLLVQPGFVTYYLSNNLRDMKGCIKLTHQCKCEVIENKPGSKSHLYRFSVVCEDRSYEFSAQDMRTRSEWLRAFKTAISHSRLPQGSPTTLNCSAITPSFVARCHARRKRSEKLSIEILEREKERKTIEETQKLLEEEKMRLELSEQKFEDEKKARLDAEKQLQLEAEQLQLKQEQLQELERLQEKLQTLLEEETQAKQDEQLVRAAQARILQEEFDRRDQLEKLQDEMKNSLEAERKCREELEMKHQEQLEQMKHDQQMLAELQVEQTSEREARQHRLEQLQQQHSETLAQERQLREQLQTQRSVQEEQFNNQKEMLESLMHEKNQADDQLKEAMCKWEEAEQAKQQLREEVQNKSLPFRKIFTRPEPEDFTIISHRGLGAFSVDDFKGKSTSMSVSSNDGACSGDEVFCEKENDTVEGDGMGDENAGRDSVGGDSVGGGVTSDRELAIGNLHLIIDTDVVEL